MKTLGPIKEQTPCQRAQEDNHHFMSNCHDLALTPTIYNLERLIEKKQQHKNSVASNLLYAKYLVPLYPRKSYACAKQY